MPVKCHMYCHNKLRHIGRCQVKTSHNTSCLNDTEASGIYVKPMQTAYTTFFFFYISKTYEDSHWCVARPIEKTKTKQKTEAN